MEIVLKYLIFFRCKHINGNNQIRDRFRYFTNYNRLKPILLTSSYFGKVPNKKFVLIIILRLNKKSQKR